MQKHSSHLITVHLSCLRYVSPDADADLTVAHRIEASKCIRISHAFSLVRWHKIGELKDKHRALMKGDFANKFAEFEFVVLAVTKSEGASPSLDV
jgi:hypothetical protein